jgi:transposase
MNRYSNDLRIRAVKYAKTHSKSDTLKAFKIARQTLYDWLKLDVQGKLEDVVRYQTKKSKLSYTEIEKFTNDNPDLYYHEIGNHFNTSDENIRRILKKLNFTVKKNKRSTRKQIKD